MFVRLKKRIELYCIRKLTENGSAIEPSNVNIENRTVFGGLFGIGFALLHPKQNLALAILVKYYGYKCLQLEYQIRSLI